VAVDGRIVHLDAFDPVVALWRRALGEKLQRARAIAADGDEQVERFELYLQNR
jgi:hypothetical protein